MYDNETALEGFKAQVATLEKQLSQANQGLLTSTQGDESIQQKYTALQRKLQDQETTITLAQLEKKGQRMKIAELEQEVKRVEGLLQESEKASVSSRDAEKRYALLEEKLQDRDRALAQASEALEREKKTQGMKVAELEQEVKRVEGLLQESEKASVSSRDAGKRYA